MALAGNWPTWRNVIVTSPQSALTRISERLYWRRSFPSIVWLHSWPYALPQRDQPANVTMAKIVRI
jgi:hypothetical protein